MPMWPRWPARLRRGSADERVKAVKIALLHGWGFDAGVWDALAPLLAGDVARMDRGYFGAPVDAERPDLMIGHSLGAMLLARRWSDVPLVAINGFDRFCGADAVAPRVVARMVKRFGEDPAKVLADFRATIHAAPAPAIVSGARLGADLALLADETPAPAHRAPVLVLQAGDDPLLPPAMRAGAFAGGIERAAAVCPAGGHLLPLTQAAWCAQAIADFAR
ncbi:alpha/beta fold hydrolase [Novosphingobium sp. KACC 22771]|uniref:alpha/beta fold hydrolase n=1 Tax=Novosphingobium sp. KACC 22771 TaxID=3025670 RepID=UPI002366C9B8|nr:alpha/beta hydrolase [Novosphingobium sp. KACC 22771]WDF72646.1 alpha/beta hydrolase [Novosphingobium sp. KACC 22771]